MILLLGTGIHGQHSLVNFCSPVDIEMRELGKAASDRTACKNTEKTEHLKIEGNCNSSFCVTFHNKIKGKVFKPLLYIN